MLESLLKKEIQSTGPISIATFMQMALSHPEYGYYAKQDPFGKSGDFVTSPEISQMFGEMIGIWCAHTWQELGTPDIQIVELGPGRGTLMKDLLRGTQHITDFHKKLSVQLIESSPTLTKAQQENLADQDVTITWHETLEHLENKPTLFISNEFFDALPIHQFTFKQGNWYETMVAVDEEKNLCFASSPDPAPSSVLLTANEDEVEEGSIIELCPMAQSIMTTMSEHLKHYGGSALIIDYGYEKPLFTDSLQAVKDHKFHPILENIGDADITAHVDFAALYILAKAQDLAPFPPISQAMFLNSLGIDIRAQQLMEKATDQQKEDIQSALHRLTSPDEMGDLFKVLIII